MAQEFYTTFNPSDQVPVTQNQLYSNSNTLKSCFSGVSSPGNAETGMLWADLTDSMLKVYGTQSSWLGLINLESGAIELEDDQIESRHISPDARKGSIVEGEAIAPDSCSLRAVANPLPSKPEESPPIGTTPSWQTYETYRVGIPHNSNLSIVKMVAYMAYSRVRFSIGGAVSSEAAVTGSYSWSSEVTLNVSALSGWQYLRVQFYEINPANPGFYKGFSFRWEES